MLSMPNSAIFRLLAIVALLLPAAARAQSGLTTTTADGEHTSTELRAFGDEVLRDKVRRYGRDTNPRRRADIGGIIESVQRTVGYTTHPLQWEIVNDSALNASALPGGIIIINVGLALYCQDYGARSVSDTALVRRKYMGCMAAVIGHEFGHLALGHTERVGATVRRRQQMAQRYRQAANLTAAVRDSILMEAARFERDQELEADRAGSLYILRVGYEVQDAIDLFDSMDADERTSSEWRRRITWTGTHPRAAERVAMLEQYRGQLKLRQRDFDDALALVEFGELPDSALAMLDRVLGDFPDLQAARHARAVVLAQRWVNGTPPTELQVRPLLPAYDARFMSSIRGSSDAEGAAARRPARDAFAELYARDAHPYSLANLAVMEAYDGAATEALQKATAAAERMPNDPQVLNNLGVVHFIAGRNADARRAFERAERAAGDQVPAAVVFNLARAAVVAGDAPAARRYLDRYLRGDRRSAWAREAIAMQAALGGAPAGPAGPTGPATAPRVTSAPPTVGGVELGATRSRVLQALGSPAGGDESYGVIWRYPARGIALVLDAESGVRLMSLDKREAGEMDGVRVGDAFAQVRARIGEPELSAPTTAGTMHRYERGSWSLAILVREGVVITVTAQRSGP